ILSVGGVFVKLFNKNKYAVVMTVLAAVFAVVNLIQFNNNAVTKQRLAVAEQNLKAAVDTLRLTKDKSGKDEANKLAYLTSQLNDLKKLNYQLYSEIKNIKGNVSAVIQSDVKIVEKPVPFVVYAQLNDSTISTDFSYDSTYSPGNY